jgi:hypothetical protein
VLLIAGNAADVNNYSTVPITFLPAAALIKQLRLPLPMTA